MRDKVTGRLKIRSMHTLKFKFKAYFAKVKEWILENFLKKSVTLPQAKNPSLQSKSKVLKSPMEK